MYGYKVYFDGDKFVTDSEISKIEQEPYDSPICWYTNPELAWLDAKARNTMLQTGAWEIRTCKDCCNYFILGHSEIEWFSMRGMALPKRCVTCRKERKNGKRRS